MLLRRSAQTVQIAELRHMRRSMLDNAGTPRKVQTFGRVQCKRSAYTTSSSSSFRSTTGQYWWAGGLFIVATSACMINKPSLQLEAPQTTDKIEEQIRLDPSTSQPFPTTLPTPLTALPSECKELVLVGLGVRTVSFLRVKVYVAGLYIDVNALEKLSKVEGWANFEQAWMMDSKDKHSGEELLSTLLDQGVVFAIRIGECLCVSTYLR